MTEGGPTDAAREAARSRIAYRRDLSKVGGRFEFAAWVFTLCGMVLIFSRVLLGVDYGAYQSLGDQWEGTTALTALP